MADLQVLVDTSASVIETFSYNGDPQDLDSGVPTVVARYPDGTLVTPAPTATSSFTGRTAGQYLITLDAEPEVTYLDLDWTGNVGGRTQTLHGRVEWIGALLFTTAQLRGLRVGSGKPFEDDVAYPDSAVQQARAEVLDDFTSYLGFSPVPRFAREVHSSNGAPILLGQRVECRLLAITVGGVAGLPTDYYVTPNGSLTAASGYLYGPTIPTGLANVAVEYQHGWSRVKGKGGHMALLTAAAQLNPAAYSSASTVSLPGGETYTYEPSETGRGGFVRFTDIKPVNKWLNQYRLVGASA
jgi:hypothetical protein